MSLPSLALSYPNVPEGWRPRETDGGTIALCPKCARQYIDDFPVGSAVLRSPCCVNTELKRCSRMATAADRTGHPMERFGWTVVTAAGSSGERAANERANGETDV